MDNFILNQALAQPLAQQALAALSKTDSVAMRCLKAGIAFPAEWQTYVTALRAMVSGASAGPLPAQPAYPAGS
jgi:hypothetical protein